LPVLASMASLLLVGAPVFTRQLKIGLLAVSLASLIQTAIFHHRFARATDGLDEMLAGPPPGMHGYWSLARSQVLGSRWICRAPLGQWRPGRGGGVGHTSSADAEPHPVRFRAGHEIPASLALASHGELADFDQVLLYGDGPLPWKLKDWREVDRA